VLFRIYNFRDNELKRQKNKKKQLSFESTVRRTQPPFQMAAAARQPPATQPRPAATVANLPPFAAATGPYCHRQRR
jgi:hypothetical protein